MRSSVVEHGIADPMVAGSIPVTPFHQFLVSLDGQDTRFSPWRPGFDSRTRNRIYTLLFYNNAMVVVIEREREREREKL